VTANQASLWRCLQHAGIKDPVEGYGTLLRSSR
jgi:maleate cis-trans isomerase